MTTMRKENRTIFILGKSELILHKKGGHFTFQSKEYGKISCFQKVFYPLITEGSQVGVTLRIKGEQKEYLVLTGVDGYSAPPSYDKESIEGEPSNVSEKALYNALKFKGWEVTRRGWPDFACFRNGEFMVVEVKYKKDRQLRRMQIQVMKELAKHGIKSYFYYYDTGKLSEVTPDKEID